MPVTAKDGIKAGNDLLLFVLIAPYRVNNILKKLEQQCLRTGEKTSHHSAADRPLKREMLM